MEVTHPNTARCGPPQQNKTVLSKVIETKLNGLLKGSYTRGKEDSSLKGKTGWTLNHEGPQKQNWDSGALAKAGKAPDQIQQLLVTEALSELEREGKYLNNSLYPSG